jgi:hypothetical protein
MKERGARIVDSLEKPTHFELSVDMTGSHGAITFGHVADPGPHRF